MGVLLPWLSPSTFTDISMKNDEGAIEISQECAPQSNFLNLIAIAIAIGRKGNHKDI